MTDKKFTSGPWVVKHSESKSAFNVHGTKLGGKYKIARCPYIPVPHADFDRMEAKANAQLISCAPEMVEMLEKALDRISRLCVYADIPVEDAGKLYKHDIKSLIKKATTI